MSPSAGDFAAPGGDFSPLSASISMTGLLVNLGWDVFLWPQTGQHKHYARWANTAIWGTHLSSKG